MIKINANIKKLENKQKELITNLTVEEIEVYIDKLSKNYFSSFLNNDKTLYLQTVDQLKELINVFQFEYPNLYIYVNASLLNAINKLLADNLGNTFKPVAIHEVTIDEINTNSGLQVLAKAYAYGRSRFKSEQKDKQRIEELERENQQLKAELNKLNE